MKLGLTPSQTVGPFFGICLPWPDGPYVVPAGAASAIWLRGTVFDGAGEPVPDAMIESWQADPAGGFDPDFRGFGRCPTDQAGRWSILTVRPGRVPDRTGRLQAPHLDLSIFARGLLDRVVTRVYFAGEEANAEDPVLSDVDSARRDTLVAVAELDGFRFDIRLQGAGETVFFDV